MIRTVRVERVKPTTEVSTSEEFVSDSMRATNADIKEVREGMKILGMQQTKGEYVVTIVNKKISP